MPPYRKDDDTRVTVSPGRPARGACIACRVAARTTKDAASIRSRRPVLDVGKSTKADDRLAIPDLSPTEIPGLDCFAGHALLVGAGAPVRRIAGQKMPHDGSRGRSRLRLDGTEFLGLDCFFSHALLVGSGTPVRGIAGQKMPHVHRRRRCAVDRMPV